LHPGSHEPKTEPRQIVAPKLDGSDRGTRFEPIKYGALSSPNAARVTTTERDIAGFMSADFRCDKLLEDRKDALPQLASPLLEILVAMKLLMPSLERTRWLRSSVPAADAYFP
jgi:hypothetical protein